MFNGMNLLMERIDSNGDGASGYFPAYHYAYTYDSVNNLSYQLEQRWNTSNTSFENAEQKFFYYTSIISGVNTPGDLNGFNCRIYPNPVDESMEVMIHAMHDSNIEMKVTNADGQTVSNSSYKLKNGDNILRTDVSGLPPGIYMIHFFDLQTGIQSTSRFIKQ
jgi:hypothetical protein